MIFTRCHPLLQNWIVLHCCLHSMGVCSTAMATLVTLPHTAAPMATDWQVDPSECVNIPGNGVEHNQHATVREKAFCGQCCYIETIGIHCPPLDNLQNGNVSFGERFVGATASYTCVKGYKLIGNALRTCTVSAMWNGSVPTCESKLIYKILTARDFEQNCECIASRLLVAQCKCHLCENLSKECPVIQVLLCS